MSEQPPDPTQPDLAPGDETAPGESTGEDVCPTCAGSGQADGGTCPTCEGRGTVVEGVGGG
jgi:DnaJ-class molecular chaperone